MVEFPSTYTGQLRIDDRGILSAINQVSFEKVKRMYIVENFNTDTIRAFHGHKIEEKQALVVSGSALVILAEMVDDKEKDFGSAPSFLTSPNGYLSEPTRSILSSRNPTLLTIPAGWANGFRALEPNTKVLFFSSTTLDEAKEDDYRFSFNYFGEEIWETENR